MKTIILLGELGKRFGTRHRLDVRSPAEAVRALCANFKEFSPFVSSSHERNVGYRVLSARSDVAPEELHHPASQTITIAPVIAGAGGKFGMILLGAALITAAFMTGGASIAATGFMAGGITTTFWGGIAFNIGAALVLGGVSQLLAPAPKADQPNETNNQPSYVFDGAVNTTAQGHPVPVGYGRMIVGSAVISAGVVAEQI